MAGLFMLSKAYKTLRQLSKPNCQTGSQLRHGVSGKQLHTVSERIAEWLQHVTQLFAAASPIAPEVLALLPPSPPHLPTDCPYPKVMLDEVVTAIKCLKNNQSPGVCHILPEMLKYGGDSVHLALHRVILAIWRTEQAPPDFKQDILLPISKKGDASLCSNYQTIALQSIAVKAYASILSAQCAFQNGWQTISLMSSVANRSIMDALFSLRLLCNGAWDKGKTLYICMLDLTKAFDSVDRGMAWQILLSRGALPKLVALIKDLQTQHSAIYSQRG